MAETKAGKVLHYWGKIGVAGIRLTADLGQGDTIHLKGASSDFEQAVGSMQIEGQEIQIAKAGQEIGIKVSQKVRRGDTVYRVE